MKFTSPHFPSTSEAGSPSEASERNSAAASKPSSQSIDTSSTLLEALAARYTYNRE